MNRPRVRPTLRELEATQSYGLVLVLIFVTFTWQMAAPNEEWARLVGVLLMVAVVYLVLWTSRAEARGVRLVTVAIVAAVAVAATATFATGRTATGLLSVVNVLLVAFTIGVLGRGVMRGINARGRISLQTVTGVLCVYLLAGLFFAYVFGAIAAFGSGPFFAQGTDGTTQDDVYYSFVTLTTTGYGDLTAASGLGRAVSIVEALLGQLYLVTVVALIVSNLGRDRPAARVESEG